MSTSTFTPFELYSLPRKAALVEEFAGRPLASLRTPALILNRTSFEQNCGRVAAAVEALGLEFRMHVKTHKTAEGTRLQAASVSRPAGLIVSTLPEAWGIAASGLVSEGRVKDILYSMPVGADKLEDLTALQEKLGACVVRVMVDHPAQVRALQEAKERLGRASWSAFVKIDGGGQRAGVPPASPHLAGILDAIKASPGVELFGFYSHFGQSYSSEGQRDAESFFRGEVDCVRSAAAFARQRGMQGRWVLSVGATPTIHAATRLPRPEGTDGAGGGNDGDGEREGEGDVLEYHAGCYAVNDLQQLATGVAGLPALRVLSSVVSVYPERGEALCDAGALALSKDRGRAEGFGEVTSARGWRLGRISQEHGILAHSDPAVSSLPNASPGPREDIQIGDRVEILPQHACLACACFPWIYVVDDADKEVVADVWVPWKGW